MSIRQNAALASIEGFASLVSATAVTVVANPALTEVSGFGALRRAGVSIRDNPRLTRVSGFSSLYGAPAGLTR